jgi:hypothetical protein
MANVIIYTLATAVGNSHAMYVKEDVMTSALPTACIILIGYHKDISKSPLTKFAETRMLFWI